jgi:hypothetical protein
LFGEAMAKIRFRDSESKVVFDYPKAEGLSGDADRVVFLSQRDFYLLLNSIEYIGKFRNRVYTSKIDEIYDICSDEQWAMFQGWVEALENNLGGWPLSNEYLERIAIALEGIQADHHFIAENTEELVTLGSVLDGVEAVLGIGSPIIALLDIIRSIVPSLDIKVNATSWVLSIWEYIGWKLPILTWMGGMLTVHTVQAAATVGSAVQLLMANFMAGTQNLAGIVGWITGLWGGSNSLTSWLATIFGWFTSTEDGGSGGEDPDNDPTIRTEVNVATTLINNNAFSCTPEVHVDGCSGGCGCGSGSGAYGPGTLGPDDSPPAVLPPEGFPISFPDGPTYDTYKCKASNVLVLNLAELLYQLGGKKDTDLSQFTTYATAINSLQIQALLFYYLRGPIPAPLADWLGEKVAPYVWPYPAAAASDLTILQDIRIELLAEREEAVCDLFNASHTGGARDALETRIDGYIDATSYSAEVKADAKEIYKALLSNGFLGTLFSKDSKINTYSDVSAVDCEACGEGSYTIVIGEAQSSPGANPLTVKLIYSTFSGTCSPTLKRGTLINFSVPVTITSVTGLEGESACTGVVKYYLYPAEGAGGGDIYASNTPPSSTSGVRSLAFITGSGGSPEATITFTVD